MPQQYLLQKIYYFMLCLVAFFIPIAFNLTSLSIILLSLCWLLQVKKTFFIRFGQRKALWIWVAFFVLHIAGYFYSSDKAQALFDLQTKLSFLILPFVIGTGPEIKAGKLQNIFTGLLAGCTLSAVFCLVRSSIVWIGTGTTEQFFYHTLVRDFDANAVYFSFYIFFALALLMLYPWTNILQRRWLQLTVFIVLFAFLVLLSSKMFIILFVVLILPMFYTKIAKQQISKWVVVAGITSLIAVGSLVIFTHNPIRQRYESIFQNPSVTLVQNKNQEFNNLTLRLFLWRMAIDDLNQNHLWLTGCGIGDVAIMQKKTILNYNAQAHSLDKHPPLWNFNLHNMYIQILLMLGIPGLGILLLMVFIPFFMLRNVMTANIFFIFHIAIALLMLQEAALQTEAGIVIYAFFALIFYNIRYSAKQEAMIVSPGEH